MKKHNNLKIASRRDPNHMPLSMTSIPESPLLSPLQRRHMEAYLKRYWKDLADLAVLFRLQTGIRWNELSALQIHDCGRNCLHICRFEKTNEDAEPESDNWTDSETRGVHMVVLTQEAIHTLQLILQQERGRSEMLFACGRSFYSAHFLQNHFRQLCSQLNLTQLRDEEHPLHIVASSTKDSPQSYEDE